MNTVVAKIDDEVISGEQFIKFLKFSNEFPDLIKRFIRGKVTVHAAKKRGVEISTYEVQEAADNFRRCLGLHRAKETQEWLDGMGISADEFETFITEHIYKKKMVDILVTNETVKKYFQLNSPKFDTVDIRHIIVESKEKAGELTALLTEEPESFDELAKTYSLDDETNHIGGQISGAQRGSLPDEIDARIFNAAPGDILGPLQVDGEDIYEIIQISAIHPAKLEDATKEKISQAIYEEWLEARLKEHTVSIEN